MPSLPPGELPRPPTPEAPVHDDHLLLFARLPVAGRVKTRLAAGTSDAFARDLYARCAGLVLDALREVEAARTVHVADAADVEAMGRFVGPGFRLLPQPAGDLTTRLEHAFALAFGEGARKVVVTATDTPGLDAARIRQALTALDARDAVLGPATDGGYYLLGLRRPSPTVFQDIRWSTDAVAAQTRARLAADGLELHELDPLPDLDTADDLRRFTRARPSHPISAWVRQDGRF